MNININLEKKYFLGFFGVILVLAGIFAVYAEDPALFKKPDVGLSLDCVYATRLGNNEPLVRMITGKPGTIVPIGNATELGPEEGGEWWGLGCAEGYKKTGCDIMLTSNDSRNEQWDVYSGGVSDKGQVCLTDNEEYISGASIAINCCKIVAKGY